MADQDSTRNENTNNEHSRQTLRRSFGNAWAGIIVCVIEERNIKIHCIVAVLVVIFGLILDISMTEWYICFTLFGLIMGLELVNTAVESVVDLVTEEWQPLAKRAKDCAAGAVLTATNCRLDVEVNHGNEDRRRT